MADAVVGTGTTIHHQDLLPLSRRVLVVRLQTVALDDDRLLGGSIDDKLTVAPRKDAAVLVTVDARAFFDS